MAWKFDDNRSIYVQLIEQIQIRILTGAYTPGSRLPAVRDLAQEAGVNPNTMQRALSELEHTGIVYSVRTSGRYVTEDQKMIEQLKQDYAIREVNVFCQRMQALGLTREEILQLIQASDI